MDVACVACGGQERILEEENLKLEFEKKVGGVPWTDVAHDRDS
jgi:hypothetical protein